MSNRVLITLMCGLLILSCGPRYREATFVPARDTTFEQVTSPDKVLVLDEYDTTEWSKVGTITLVAAKVQDAIEGCRVEASKNGAQAVAEIQILSRSSTSRQTEVACIALRRDNETESVAELADEPASTEPPTIPGGAKDNVDEEPSDSGRGPYVVEAYITSKFDGYEYGNLYELSNGQIWRQIDAYIWIYIWVMPKVIIRVTGDVGHMRFEKIDHDLLVERVR